jgi:hypothetical protein
MMELSKSNNKSLAPSAVS